MTKLPTVIRDVGFYARKRINKLPKKDRATAWGCVGAAIVGAGMHDTDEPDRVAEIVQSAIAAMWGSLMIEAGLATGQPDRGPDDSNGVNRKRA